MLIKSMTEPSLAYKINKKKSIMSRQSSESGHFHILLVGLWKEETSWKVI